MEERKRKLDQSRQTVKKQQKVRRDSKRQIRKRKKVKEEKKRESRDWEWWEKLPQEKAIWEEMIRGKKENGLE